MGAGRNENDNFRLGLVAYLVGEQEIAADVTFPVATPLAIQGMIQPFGAKRGIICDQQQHRLFQPMHVKAPGTGQALPILQEGFGVICGARLGGALT